MNNLRRNILTYLVSHVIQWQVWMVNCVSMCCAWICCTTNQSLYTSPLALGRPGWPGLTGTAGFGPRSFSVAGPLAWNSLPPEIKTSLALGQFSGRLKTEMFLRSYYASAQLS